MLSFINMETAQEGPSVSLLFVQQHSKLVDHVKAIGKYSSHNDSCKSFFCGDVCVCVGGGCFDCQNAWMHNYRVKKENVSLLVYVHYRLHWFICKIVNHYIWFVFIATSCVYLLCFSSAWLVGSSLPSSSIARRCVGWPFVTPWLS